jgi:hypothetical protein
MEDRGDGSWWEEASVVWEAEDEARRERVWDPKEEEERGERVRMRVCDVANGI